MNTERRVAIETRSGKELEADLHQFVVRVEGGVGWVHNSVEGIVEWPDGRIESIHINRIRFLHEYT